MLVNTPFFSVITPNFNSGDKLLRAAKSLSTNNISYEHIIVDDCSMDQSFVLPSEMESFSKVSRNQINLGPGPSRNRGLQIAKGRYVVFLDSDDYFVPGALDIIHKVLVSSSYPDVLVFGYHLVRSENSRLWFNEHGPKMLDVAPLSWNSLLRKYLLDEIVSAPWGKCISATIAQKSRFPSLRMAEDSFYNLDVFMQAETASITDDKLYVFDKTDLSSLTSKSFDYREFKELYRAWIAFERRVLNDANLNRYKDYLYTRKIKFCVLYCMNRLSLTPDSQLDVRVIKMVQALFLRNFWLARKNLSGKSIVAAVLFCLLPRFSLRILRARIVK